MERESPSCVCGGGDELFDGFSHLSKNVNFLMALIERLHCEFRTAAVRV